MTSAAGPVAPPSRPRRRWLRWALLALALLVLLPLAGAAVFLAAFDPDSQKPRIQAAVEAATGRALALNGPIRAKLSLAPTVALHDVALANPPGAFSRPAMLTARRAEVQLAVLPLLLERRLELRRVVLDGPDLLLETDAAGRPNWIFAPPARPPADPAAPPAAPRRPMDLGVGRLLVTDGVVAWRRAPGAAPVAVAVRRLEVATADGRADGDLRLDGAFAAADVPFTLSGQVGPPAALLAPGAAPARPWPVRLALESAALGARLALEGEVARPAERRGYRLAATAALADPARLAPLLPAGLPVPPLRGIEASATIAEAPGGGAPSLSDLRLAAGESDLGALRPGLRLLRLAATLPRPDAPLALEGEARQGELPVALAGSVGPLGALLGGAPAPLPVDLRLTTGAATATAKGAIADPRAMTGVDLAVALRAPDLAAVAPLAPGVAFPPLRDVALDARLAERGPAFAQGVALRDLKATASAGDLAGELALARGGPRPGVAGTLTSARLDLDALRPAPSPSAAAAAAAAAAPPQAAEPPPAATRRIPDLPLPLDALRALDADLRLAVGVLRTGGRDYRDVAAHAVLRDGAQARLDPLDLTLPGGAGRLLLRAAADLSADPPAVQLAARSDGSGLDLGPLLAAYGLPARATGRLELDADLRGRGRDVRALAATVFGHLGLALPGGRVDRALLEALPGELERLLGAGARTGELGLRCAALRLDARDGQAAVRALLVEAPGLGRVGGEGGVNLRDETLALRLLPDLRVGPVNLRAPINLGGTLMRPRVGVSPEAAIAGGLGAFLSLQRTPDRGLGAVAEALGGGGAAPALPDCGAALAAARGGRAGPVPPPAVAEAPAPPAPAPEAPASRDLPAPAQELLRRLPIPGLFGR